MPVQLSMVRDREIGLKALFSGTTATVASHLPFSGSVQASGVEEADGVEAAAEPKVLLRQQRMARCRSFRGSRRHLTVIVSRQSYVPRRGQLW